MSEKIEISDKAITAISSAAERLIGYFYSGVLPVLIISIEKGAMVKSFVEATGGVFAFIICFALGIGIYTTYYRIVGELFLYPLQHLIHILFDNLTGRRTSTIAQLHEYGVPYLRSRDAYSAIREQFFSEERRTSLQVDHGELHVLYITSIVTFLSYFALAHVNGAPPSKVYLVVSGISLIAALIGDTRQHSRECMLLKENQTELVDFLRKARFLSS